MLTWVLITVLGVFLVVGGIVIRNLLTQVEEYEEWATSAHIMIVRAIDRMRDIDLRGSFESDDEVGAVFLDLKDAVTELEQILPKDIDAPIQEKRDDLFGEAQ